MGHVWPPRKFLLKSRTLSHSSPSKYCSVSSLTSNDGGNVDSTSNPTSTKIVSFAMAPTRKIWCRGGSWRHAHADQCYLHLVSHHPRHIVYNQSSWESRMGSICAREWLLPSFAVGNRMGLLEWTWRRRVCMGTFFCGGGARSGLSSGRLCELANRWGS